MLLRSASWDITLVVLAFSFGLNIQTCWAINLYVVSTKGGEPELIYQGEGRELGSPEWSPDGSLIACDTWKQGENLQASRIAIVPAKGGELKILGLGAMPSWSPDGTQLVCHTYNPNQIVVLNVDGSGREAILDQWGSPRWAPDGKSIFTVYLRGGIAKSDLASGKQSVELAKHMSITHGFSISPNGKHCCFSLSDRGLGVATYDPKGKSWTIQRFANSYRCTHSSWSPDNRRLVFYGNRINSGTYERGKARYTLFILDTDPKAEKRLYPLPGIPAKRYCASPDWSPDGKYIAFVGNLEP